MNDPFCVFSISSAFLFEVVLHISLVHRRVNVDFTVVICLVLVVLSLLHVIPVVCTKEISIVLYCFT